MTAIKGIGLGWMIAGLVLGSAATPVFAESTLEITDNGVWSNNKIVVKQACVSAVAQESKTTAVTDVVSVATTGGNQAIGNTGGTTLVDTGDATSTVTVSVTGGDNVAAAPNCCECVACDTQATIDGNGVGSRNKVIVSDWALNLVEQKAKTKAFTGVASVVKTGKNKAKWNTGSGTSVLTGNAESTVEVTVAGGSNLLTP